MRRKAMVEYAYPNGSIPRRVALWIGKTKFQPMTMDIETACAACGVLLYAGEGRLETPNGYTVCSDPCGDEAEMDHADREAGR